MLREPVNSGEANTVSEESPVVRSMDDAKKYTASDEVLVPTRGDLGAAVWWFSNMLNSPDDSEPGRIIKRLIASSGQSDVQ